MRSRSVALVAVATFVLAGCSTGAPVTVQPSSSPLITPATTPAASPSAASLPAELVGTWAGVEDDANSGETWQTTYRLEPCRQHDQPWVKPADDQVCGEWTGDATIEGLPAHCTATLYWLEQEGDDYLFLASGPGGAKYRTIPHPYVKIDDKWYCWDTFRFRLSPEATGSFAVETIGAGALAGAFAATTGTVTRSAAP